MAFPGNTSAEVPPGFLRARPVTGRHPTHRARLSAGMTYYSCSPLLDYCGGAEGTRTPDLISAIDALSQLSYSPKSRISIVRSTRMSNQLEILPSAFDRNPEMC